MNMISVYKFYSVDYKATLDQNISINMMLLTLFIISIRMTDNKDQNVGLVSQNKKYKYPENDPDYKGNQLDQNLRDGMI